MLKKIPIIILAVTLLFIISGCNMGEENINGREEYIIDSGSYVLENEEMLFKNSDLIFKGTVIDAKEISIDEYLDGELNYVYYFDVFTFEVENVYYSGDPFSEGISVETGDVIKVSNGSCDSDWVPGTLKMEKGKRYIVMTERGVDLSNIKFTKYFDYYTGGPWASIIPVEDGKYYVDEILTSLTDNALEEFIRKDEQDGKILYETTVYVKGEGFENELEALILEKKGES
ncbi:MAG: hypothetical protein U9O59_00965 [Actinomycetota bacterium]|nr:hypothetical protein [Actinomycetota bacterium]